MRIALVARADNRGLGLQTWELYRHLEPERTIVADLEELSPYHNHLNRYPDRWGVKNLTWNSRREMRDFLRGMDVLLTCETPYWYELIDEARELGVKTAVQYNHEFCRWLTTPELPRPDLFIAPSTWNIEQVPGAVYLPLGIDRERLPFHLRREAKTFLHVAGHRTRLDRNGTRTVLHAAQLVESSVKIVIRSQSSLGVDPYAGHLGANVEIEVDDLENYWDLYRTGDVLLLPRRFGGQSLPMSEALSTGMPVIMPNIEPQRKFLPVESLVPASLEETAAMQVGPVDVYATDPVALARRIDEFAQDPALVERLSKEADDWAEHHSWHKLIPRWRKVLRDLCAA